MALNVIRQNASETKIGAQLDYSQATNINITLRYLQIKRDHVKIINIAPNVPSPSLKTNTIKLNRGQASRSSEKHGQASRD